MIFDDLLTVAYGTIITALRRPADTRSLGDAHI
jgi:hypothetical protein